MKTPTISIKSETPDGVICYTLQNGQLEVDILNLGGIIQAIRCPNANGDIADVVLGYDTPAEYGQFYFGALIGRFANRIALGKFILDEVEYQLAVNNGPNHLHGGTVGFDKKLWKSTVVDGSKLCLEYQSVDGEENYPGTLNVKVTYEVSSDGELVIDYRATCDKATILNLTNHSYFNLEGHDKGDIYNHEVRLTCKQYTPPDSTNIPTGEIRDTERSAFDLVNPKTLSAEVLANVPGDIGYDHNLIVPGDVGVKRLVGVVKAGGRVMETYSTQPAVQFYTSHFVDSPTGKNGARYGRYSALCLETQNYPDAPNKPNFPNSVLRPGEEYHHTTWYKFSTQ